MKDVGILIAILIAITFVIKLLKEEYR